MCPFTLIFILLAVLGLGGGSADGLGKVLTALLGGAA